MNRLFLGLLTGLAGHAALAAGDPGHPCLIEPYQRIEMRSPAEAIIDKVLVQRGARVQQGQLLVQLDVGVEEAALAAAKYRAVMEGRVRTAQEKVEFAREKARRRDELVKKKYVSAQDRDDAFSDLRLAEGELVAANDDRNLAALEEKRLSQVMRQRQLRSPFSGVVTERLQNPGELAQTGEGARPILKLAQTHPLRVEVILPVSSFGKIKARSKADVAPEPPLSGRYQATVQIVDSVVDSASGTFGVRLELPNPSGSIPAGVKCRVKFAE
ncbi:MAG: efflux RND transporter periplasmic adaptor subunit [Azonexus sp.]|jgi:RND family efflux transporter MFP subunit|nr:efflux RND transporter periplasmic adaptor subunit [Azonexus sp.]